MYVCVYVCICVYMYVCMLDYEFVGVKMRGGEWRGLGYDGVRGLGGKYRRIKREVCLVVGFVRAGREKNTGGVEGRGDRRGCDGMRGWQRAMSWNGEVR